MRHIAITTLLACLICSSVFAAQSDKLNVKTQYLQGDEARNAILSEEINPYYSQMQAREIAASTGQPILTDTPLEKQRQIAKQRFSDFVMPISKDEQAVLDQLCQQINDLLGDDYPLLRETTWQFIKVHNDCCGSFPHTRHHAIILSEVWFQRAMQLSSTDIKTDYTAQRLAELFLHEQLHVLQRLHPQRFATLYKQAWGFEPIEITLSPWMQTNLMQNPDASNTWWRIALDEDLNPDTPDTWWAGATFLAEGNNPPIMGQDFRGGLFRIEQTDDGKWAPVNQQASPILHNPLRFADYGKGLPQSIISSGGDHPHELLAYSMPSVLKLALLKASNNSPEVPKEFSDFEALLKTALASTTSETPITPKTD